MAFQDTTTDCTLIKMCSGGSSVAEAGPPVSEKTIRRHKDKQQGFTLLSVRAPPNIDDYTKSPGKINIYQNSQNQIELF